MKEDCLHCCPNYKLQHKHKHTIDEFEIQTPATREECILVNAVGNIARRNDFVMYYLATYVDRRYVLIFCIIKMKSFASSVVLSKKKSNVGTIELTNTYICAGGRRRSVI
jgi:hypothetical protein